MASHASCRPTHHVQENKRRWGRIFWSCSMVSKYRRLSWLDSIGAAEQPASFRRCGLSACAGL